MRLLLIAKCLSAAPFAALLLALCPSALQAQLPDVDPNVQFQLEELPLGSINLFPGFDQPPTEFTSNGIVLQFGPHQTAPGGTASMEFAMIDPAPAGIESPNALFLIGTNALFNLNEVNLLPDETVTGVAFQLQGDGSGATLNLGVNDQLPYVGLANQLPASLPDGITVEVIPGELPTMATLILTGNIAKVEIGGNIALGNLLVYAGEPSLNDIPGCTQTSACNYNPGATVEDGSCNFDPSHFFSMTVNLDQYPQETTWSLIDALGDTVLIGGPYESGTDNFATHVTTTSLCAGCYTLTIFDQFSDGMCCQFGNGSYSLTIDGQTVASGGEFLEFETTEVCTPGLEGMGCTYDVALNYDPTAIEDDGSCIFPNCPDPCAFDLDEDGICDDIDSCIGTLDECGVCNGNGATLACGCEDFPTGACDCEGNQLDALGICGGTCSGDVDGDGECDDIDCCVGGYDECGVCNGPGPVYDCGCNMLPPGACDCGGSLLDALGVCGGDCPSDLDGDGICDTVDDCVGYIDVCGVCNGPGPIFTCGCSPLPPGDCDCQGNQLDALGVCGGDCLSDTDGDGLCDSEEVPGCMDGLACNYNPQATDDNGTCNYAEAGYDCLGNCLLDTDDDGICDDNEVPGCIEPGACNFNAQATDNEGCYYPLPSFNCAGECIEDLDEDGVCDGIEVFGCTDDEACNFNPEATEESGTCLYPVPLYDCLGNCLSDDNGDGLCDGQEILGCMDTEACNHNPNATIEDPNLPCLYAVPGYDCQGNGIIIGCMDPTACNYNANATLSSDNEECLYAVPNYDCQGNCIDYDDNGVCDADEVMGCTYPSAENFSLAATEDDGSCEFPIDPEPGPPCPDIDGDGSVSVPDLLLLLGQFGEQIDC